MSVINNVLKDLENKPSSFTRLDLADVPASQKNNRMQIKRSAGVFMILLGVVTGAFFTYLYSVRAAEQNIQLRQEVVEPEPVRKMTEIDTEQAAVLSPIALAQADKKTEITGLQLKESDEFLELTLQLPIGAQSFLKQSSQNKYVFLISNAAKKIIPPLIKENSWLQSISIQEAENGVEIQFDTAQNILVETHHNEQGSHYFWVIRLKKATLPTVPEPVKSSTEIAQKTSGQKTGSTQQAADKTDLNAVESITMTELDSSLKQPVKLEIKAVKSGVTDAQRLNKARLSMRQENWLAAQQQLEKLLDGKLDKTARIQLLTVYQRQQNISAMQQLLDESLLKYPDESVLHLFDAGQLFAEKKYQVLIDRYSARPQNKALINLLAASLQSTGRHELAIQYYRQSLKMDPQQPRNWISLAISQEQVSNFEQALQSYQMAARSGVINSRLQSFIGQRIQHLTGMN